MNVDASRFVVTGATGFVGRSLSVILEGGVEPLRLSADDWQARIAAVDWREATVIHLAARVHEFDAGEAEHERDNVTKTLALAQAASSGGARRLVFLSTIKVHGEATGARPFSATDVPAPQGPYARSKWAAEEGLAALSARSGLPVVVVRSPLVAGAGVRGNLEALVGLCRSRWPLPFASIRNRRAMIDVEDLARLLAIAATHGRAPGRTWLCAGPTSPSTPEIVGAIRRALGRPAGLFPVPEVLLRLGAAIAGQAGRASRLWESLDVDDADTRLELGWTPRVTLDESAAAMVRGGAAT